MPVFKTMPSAEAALISRHLLKLKDVQFKKSKKFDQVIRQKGSKKVNSMSEQEQLDKLSNVFKPGKKD